MDKLSNRLSSSKVLVVGDIILDRYYFGDSTRISPEAPVPVVNIDSSTNRLGGAANVADNISSIGCKTTLLGIISKDSEGKLISEMCQKKGILLKSVFDTAGSTIKKIRVISRGQQSVRLDFESTFSEAIAKEIFINFKNIYKDYDLIILSDYNKGTLFFSRQIIEMAKSEDITTIVDPKGDDYEKYAFADVVTPNYKEFESVVGRCRTETEIEKRSSELISKYKINSLLITRGAKGMSLFSTGEKPVHFSTKSEEVYDVTGAGDTVCGVLGGLISAGEPLVRSVEMANAAAAKVIRTMGASSIGKDELLSLYFSKDFGKKVVYTLEELQVECAALKANGENIVFTNGCFDLLHSGHTRYLEEAKALGDKLIVAVNSDDSIKKIKGLDRPINNFAERARVLAALSSVDYIICFSEDTPISLIRNLQPDLLVKGGDYRVKDIVGSDEVIEYGGKVKVLTHYSSLSSSNLLAKLSGK